MKVLLKSLKELEEEFTIDDNNDYLLAFDGLILFDDMLDLLGKVHIAEYEKELDAYVINDWYFHSSLIKGEIEKT